MLAKDNNGRRRIGCEAGFIKIGTYCNMIHHSGEDDNRGGHRTKPAKAPIWGHTEAGTMGMEVLDILKMKVWI